jgi:DNA replicative helicase MCM subunit Mcm2 (Cdc46/Mcm family)
VNKTTKDLQDLTVEELYSLARKREKEEAGRAEKGFARKREELKMKRKELVARQRKELAAVDREIRKLEGTVRRRGSTKARRERGGATIVEQVRAIVAAEHEMAIGEIREKAEETGVDTRNLSQTLAYLKRQGRLDSPRRGVYAAP